MGANTTIQIRAARPEDHRAIIDLAARSLGWRSGDPNEDLFRWKHLDNPYGASSMWLAVDDDRIVGFRAFLRWSFEDPERGIQSAVRAVDTATDPAFRGQGVFTALTRHGLEAERAAGTDFVFNTPNDQSRPGYLKMGWQVVGRVPVAVVVGSPASALRMIRARVPAGKWSEPCAAGFAAPDVFADESAVADLLATVAPPRGLRTWRTATTLRWRYGLEPLRYRVVLRGASVADGLAVFRVRRRGAAVETALVDLIVPAGDRRAARGLVGAVMEATRPDYLIAVQRRPIVGRSIRLPGQGPLLTWRGVNRTAVPDLSSWDLALGDIELF